MTIENWIKRNADFSPQKIAIRFDGQAITYGELSAQIDLAVGMFRTELGINYGDRVALLAYNSPEFLVTLFACAQIGAILVPLNWRLASAEHCYILKDADVKALILEQDFLSLAEPLQADLPNCQLIGLDFVPDGGRAWSGLLANAHADSRAEGSLDSPLLIVYTSGTTGYPKGAVLTQNALTWNAINSIHLHDMTSEDHILTVLPLFHVGGLNNQTTPALHCGATVTLHRRFHPDQTLSAIHADQPTLTCLVPATMQAVIQSHRWAETDFSALRIVLTGSTTIPHDLSERFRERGPAVLEMYGATETSPIAIYHRIDSDFTKRGSTGLPALHCAVRVVDDEGNELPIGDAGEILVKGPTILSHYWNNHAATTEALRDGWYYTGDIGYRDADGYYYVCDRKKNLIISGGENIYPAEVERLLMDHEGVQDVAVIGTPHPQWQEVPVAIIVPVADQAPSEEALRTFLSTQLARYKMPRKFVFTTSLPKNAMGKVQHFKVREAYRQSGIPVKK